MGLVLASTHTPRAERASRIRSLPLLAMGSCGPVLRRSRSGLEGQRRGLLSMCIVFHTLPGWTMGAPSGLSTSIRLPTNYALLTTWTRRCNYPRRLGEIDVISCPICTYTASCILILDLGTRISHHHTANIRSSTPSVSCVYLGDIM